MTSLKYIVSSNRVNLFSYWSALLKICFQSDLKISLSLQKGILERLHTRIMTKE